jgi:hypothetical protein
MGTSGKSGDFTLELFPFLFHVYFVLRANLIGQDVDFTIEPFKPNKRGITK